MVVALAAVHGLTLTGVDATVAATCLAASNSDRRVNYDFCVSELNKHRDSPGADTPGLAKVAANVGVNSAGGAVNDIEALLAAKQPPPDARTSAALRLCEQLYYDMELAFAGAYDDINALNYTAGKQMAADADSLVRRCAGGFAEAGLVPPEPVARRGAYAVQIAIVCAAITNLIISP
jgi:pectinesterase inhibitor-like protein